MSSDEVASSLTAAPPDKGKTADKGKPAADKTAPDKSAPKSEAVVPLYSPEEDIKTFKLPPGLKLECVAAEPLVSYPIHAAFDAGGKLWVVELVNYMPDPDKGSKTDMNPIARVSYLEDTDGDGKFDKKTVFLDGLVQPRAVGFAGDGVLIVSPPSLLFCKIDPKTGACGEKTVIANDLGNPGNPEYKINGLLRALDNWVYNAQYMVRWRYFKGKFYSEVTVNRGQWGISQDDLGRLFYNGNSTSLHADLAPMSYLTRTSNYKGVALNYRVHENDNVFPSHHVINNRGKENEVLKSVTAACGPQIYRAELLGKEYEGNAFVCEPVGNLIRRLVLTESNGLIKGRSPYDKVDFCTSTDERFRPVHLMTGPEGALYIVDMHHGMIQYKGYLTEYAKNGYVSRGLEKNTGMGRIWRIVPDNAKAIPPGPKLDKLAGKGLVAYLGDSNGWRRDTAQRLLVDRRDADDLDDIREFVAKSPTPLGKIHALWTLQGLESQDAASVIAGMKDANPDVRANALRVAEPVFRVQTSRAAVLAAALKLATDQDYHVRLQFCFTMGEFGSSESDNALLNIMAASPSDTLLKDAVLSGLRGREQSFLQQVLTNAEWKRKVDGRDKMITSLAAAMFGGRSAKDILHLIGVIAALPPSESWQKEALLAGAKEAADAKLVRKPIRLPEEPSQLVAMAAKETGKVKDGANAMLNFLVWEGKPGYKPPPPPPPLSASQQALFDQGSKVYAETCAKCHQPDGMGREGVAPALIDSEWVLGSDRRMARGLLAGIQGPIVVDRRTTTLEMPALRTLSDEDIAAAMTYARRSWDHEATPVEPSMVAAIRKETNSRTQPFTAKELEKLTN